MPTIICVYEIISLNIFSLKLIINFLKRWACLLGGPRLQAYLPNLLDRYYMLCNSRVVSNQIKNGLLNSILHKLVSILFQPF
jgi:hypothetical protein